MTEVNDDIYLFTINICNIPKKLKICKNKQNKTVY